MDGKRTTFWHHRLRAATARSVLAPAVLLLVSVAAPGAVNAQYTESFQTWSATSPDTWETKDLAAAPFNVPANAVVEVAVRNANTTTELWGGVRAVGSGLERRFQLHESEGAVASFDILVMHVQTDASSDIQHYSDVTADVNFVLLGYWTSGTYVEAFDTFTAGASGSWQDKDLCSYGVVPSGVAEIVMTNDDPANELEAGVRINGSALERRLDLHEAEDGGVDAATMFVKADDAATVTVEVYAETDANIDFYVVGYWSAAPRSYTELFTDVGSPGSDATWEDLDLTASGVPDDAIAEFVLSNNTTNFAREMGLRSNGSSLSRFLDLHEAESGGTDLNRMHVTSDATATIEFYHESINQAHTFRLVGYWDSCDTAISYVISDLGAVTAANSSLGLHINTSGDVAGFEEDASGDPDAWFSECGAFTSLGTLGGSNAESLGINDAEMVVGWAQDGSGNRKPFTWTSGGGMTDLGLVSGRTDGESLAVNSSSEVVGTVLDFGIPPDNRLAFIELPLAAYTLSAGMTSLGTFGGVQSVAMDINDSGQVVGGAQYANRNMRPFRWANGTMTDLGTLGGENESVLHRGQAINSSGNVVGQSYTGGGAAHAFYYDGSMTDLGVLAGGDTSLALGINDGNVVVGTSDVTGGIFHAFVWDSTNGLRDLNNLVSGTWTLMRATDINNNGDIVGFGTNPSGDVRAFLLTPSCSAGGGGAAFAPGFPPDLGVLDEAGRFGKSFLGANGQPVAEILVTGGEPGATLEFIVTDQNEHVGDQILPPLRTLDGFADGVALPRTLEVVASTAPGSFQATVILVTSLEELSELHVDAEEMALHVLDPTQGAPPGRWMPAGENISEAAPTGVVGESGFVVFTDGTVDYWAVRDDGGIFAVGKPERDKTRSVHSGRSAGLCGIGLTGPALLLTFVFFIRRTGRRARPMTARDFAKHPSRGL